MSGAPASGPQMTGGNGPPPIVADPPETGRRSLTARGTVINAVFTGLLGSLNFFQAMIVAGLLTAAEFGVWTVVLVTSTLLVAVKMAIVSDKYIQQSEPDQVVAFQKAFTLDLMSSLVLALVMAAAAPVMALAYGRDELLAPALVMALMIPALGLRSPIWVFYRRMEFMKTRTLQAIEPVVALIVTIGLVLAGSGYWSLIIGSVVGAWATALAALLLSPLPLRLRFDWETTKHYFTFSTPLIIGSVSGMLMAQGSVIASEAALGLAGAGAIGLASTFRAYTGRVELLINRTIYPAVCRVVDRKDLLIEVAVKANRLSMMWGIPFGVAVALFSADLVNFALGDTWTEAVIVLQVFGLSAALDQIGLNWSVFYRAVERTRPIAVVAVVATIAFSVTALPLLFVLGLDGYAIGLGVTTVVSLGLRARYLRELFPEMQLGRHAVRALAPVAPAAGLVLLARLVGTGERTGAMAAAELTAFIVLSVAATILAERRLLREMWGYLRGRGKAAPSPA